jgi:hypothetical protein
MSVRKGRSTSAPEAPKTSPFLPSSALAIIVTYIQQNEFLNNPTVKSSIGKTLTKCCI